MTLLYIVNKRLISLLVVVIMLVGLFPLSAFATEASNASVEFSVTERNGVTVSDHLISRGVPFCRGEVYPADCFALQNGSTEVPVQTKAMELYDDGSVKWLKFSFVENLSANETKNYVLAKKEASKTTDIAASIQDNEAILKNSLLSIKVNGFGISSLTYQGIEVLSDGGISLISLTDAEYSLKSGKVQLSEVGNVYATVKIKGEFAETGMTAEQVYTILSGSSKIISEVRFMASGDTALNGLAQTINLKNGFTKETHQSTSYISVSDIPMYSCGSMSIYNSGDNIKLNMVSREPAIYRGAVSNTASNGFKFESAARRMLFAPIHYDVPYTWIDGTNRTAYSEIILCAGNNTSYINNLKTLENTPAVSFEENPFIRAGIIENDYIANVTALQIDAIKWLKNRRYGRMDAGSIPYVVDPDHDKTGNWIVRPGEVDYNIWYAQMLSGDPMLYDIVNESTQCWADINIYKGETDWLYGATRYRNSFDHSNYEISQPYYGDNSGLYIGYLLTGNEYYKEMLELVADYFVKVATTYKSHGYAVPRPIDFRTGSPVPMSHVEIRYMMQTRALLNSYNLLGKQEYLDVMNSMFQWAKAWQHPEGYWRQAWDDNQGPYDFQWKKNYIMLYGLRGVCEVYKQTKHETAKEILINFANYLITEMQPNGGWMWDPNQGEGEVNEGDERGNSPFQEGMATEIFNTVYNITGEEKYLEAMLTLTRYYLGSTMPGSGFVSVRYCDDEHLDGFINSVVCGQASTLARTSPDMHKTIKENEELVSKLGFSDIVDYYCYNAVNVTDEIENPYDSYEVTIHAFEKDNRRTVYIVNHSGANTGEWKKDITINAGGGWLFEGVENEVTSEFSNKINTTLDMFEIAVAKSIPVKVVSQLQTVKANVIEYNEDEIVLDVYSEAGEITLEISDGLFKTEANRRYNYHIDNSPDGEYKRIKLTKAGKCGIIQADDSGIINVSMDFGGVVSVYSDIETHWAKNSIQSLAYSGVLSAENESVFNPDEEISTGEYIGLLTKATGIDESVLSDGTDLSATLTREQMADIAARVIELKNGNIDAEQFGILVKNALVPAKLASDEEAVKRDIERLSIENQNEISSNIPLTYSGIYGSSISWKSSNAEVVADNGVINRPEAGSDNAKAVLTATVKRGGYTMEKAFDVTVLNREYVNYPSSMALTNAIYPIKKNDGTQSIRFTVHSTLDIVDCVIAHFNTANGLSVNADMPIIIRFNSEGAFDAYNYNSYQHIDEVKYTKDTDYTFDITIDYKKQLYDVKVCGPDGKWYEIAKDYQFRATAKPLGFSDAVVITSAAGDGHGIITKHSNAIIADNSEAVIGDYTKGYTVSDVVLEQNNSNGDKLNWYSFVPEIITQGGKLVSRPESDTKVKLFGIPSTALIFDDFSEISQVYAENVLKCGLLKIVTMNGNEFNPAAAATKAEAATIVQRVKSYLNK